MTRPGQTRYSAINPPRRLPYAPLEAYLAGRLGRVSKGRLSGLRTTVSSSCAQRIYRARRNGYVGMAAADEIAGCLGCHPSEIWDEWFAEDG